MVPPQALHRFFGEDVREVSAIRLPGSAIVVKAPLIIGDPPSTESHELRKTASFGMVTTIERTQMPFADDSRRIARGLEIIGDCHLPEGEPIKTTSFQGIDCSSAMGIASGHQCRTRPSTDRGSRIMLRKADALANQRVDHWSLRRTVTEDADIAIPHIVGQEKDDIRPSKW